MKLHVVLILKCLIGLVLGKAVHKEPTAASIEPSTAASAVPQTVKAEVPQTESAPPSASKSSCSSPIGIQTGFLETRDIKTSTSQKGFTATDPWCATTQDDQQFMAVDLGEPFKINKVATLGKADDKNRFVSKYILEFSHDGAKWEQYQDPAGKRELTGNENTYDVKSNPLSPNIEARYVKLKPLQWSAGGICTSFDLFGCTVDELNKGKKSS